MCVCVRVNLWCNLVFQQSHYVDRSQEANLNRVEWNLYSEWPYWMSISYGQFCLFISHSCVLSIVSVLIILLLHISYVFKKKKKKERERLGLYERCWTLCFCFFFFPMPVEPIASVVCAQGNMFLFLQEHSTPTYWFQTYNTALTPSLRRDCLKTFSRINNAGTVGMTRHI